MTTIAPLDLNYRPHLPAVADYGIGIVGCGGIVNYAHLPAYNAHRLRVLAKKFIPREDAERPLGTPIQ